MIDVTVKTLDSQNHRFSVPDDITVQQFKDRIASSVSIPSDKQRLIYCGRVLQDDKNLSDYNVHEKVIHLVMRAPPQASGRGNDSASNNDAGQIPSRGSHRSARAQGRHVLFGSIVVPEDAIDDLTSTTTRGPSSSGVRLQQAKTMLDRASEVIDQLEEVFATNSSRPSTSSTPSSDESPHTESPDDPVGATGNSEGSSTSNEDSSSKKSQAAKKKGFDSAARLQPPTSIPAEELESLYMEMDALNNTYNSMEPSLMGGTQVIPQIGSPFVGAISTSLAGGLAHAASAAFASAFSSMNGSSSAPSSSVPTGTTLSSSASSSTTPITTSQSSGTNSSGNSTSPSASSFESFLNSVRSAYSSSSPSTTNNTSSTTSSSATSAPTTSSSTSAGSHPHNSVRGITVRITNRSQRPTGIRLEHPRCSVMVEVLDQYQDIQQRLQPFLSQYYRTLANDQTYENINDRQLQADQYILWRVSAAMHFISHAMHAISDIIIDLRRNPPRQLRARPIIIPQPAIVQAQINVAHNPDASQSPRNTSRSTPRAARSSNTPGTTTTGFGSAGSGVPNAANASDSSPMADAGNSHRNIMELDDGVVVMHVGPNGFTIDSISAENNNDELNGNPPPELLQNLMSTLTSQLGMNLGNVAVSSTPNAPTTASSSSQSASGAGRTAAPVHNSQATGNSGTNTTNATQTRVTPRPHVHVTPLHVPGMGMTQFDPFLPCQSHHIRPSAARQRWRHATTNQTPTNAAAPESNENQQSTNSTQTASNVSSQEPTTSNARPQNMVVEHFLSSVLGNVLSSSVNDDLSEEQLNQENMLAELIRGVSAELCGTLGSQRREPESGSQSQAATLHEFLEPFSGGRFFTELESDNFFAQLFTIISQSISLGDLVQIFFGDSQRLNQLRIPLQTFIQERLGGAEPTDANISRTIDGIIVTLDPYLVAATGGATVNDGIDFLHTIHNFFRQRICDIISLIFDTEASTFGPALFNLMQHSFRELIAICVHCFSDGVQELERLVEARVQAVMSGMRPSIQTWSVNTSLVQLRSMLSQLTITDDQIRHFIVTPNESPRTSELGLAEASIAEVSDKSSTDKNKEKHNEKDIEDMEVDDLGRVEEVSTTTENGLEGAMAADDPISVTIGSQPWHSAVPQDWIPVLTRDVERQRRGVPDTNLSDAYLYGMPIKRRKICSQKKPHGTVQQVVQDTLRQALRTSGVNRTLTESVSGEVSNQLTDSFSNHVRSSLKEHLENNQDFKPEKFPKSEQKIRRN